MASVIDLVTLPQAKAWLGVVDAQSDLQLQSLITGASRFVCNYTGRSTFQPSTITDLYDGYGKDWMLLRQWPVISITSIAYDATTITQAATGMPLANGYYLEPVLPAGGNQRLTLFGYCFPRGRSNVQVVYTTGYASTPEDITDACMELVGERFRRKDRIGQTSKSLGGQETVSFSQKDMNDAVRDALDFYARKIPC